MDLQVIDVDAIKRKMARDFMEEIEMMIGERMKEERKKICPQLKFMGEFAANLNAVNDSKTHKIQKERDDWQPEFSLLLFHWG